jgi:hypothetical protein
MTSPNTPSPTSPKMGYCSSGSGKAGCTGYRLVTPYGRFWFCTRCWIHRKRLAKTLARMEATS